VAYVALQVGRALYVRHILYIVDQVTFAFVGRDDRDGYCVSEVTDLI